MQILKNRFLVISCIVAVGVMALSACLPPEFSVAVIAVGIVGGIICAAMAVFVCMKGSESRRKLKDIFLYVTVTLVLVSVLTSGGYGFFQKDMAVARRHDGGEVTAKGVAERIRYDLSYYSAVEVRITEINGEAVDLRAIVEFESVSPIDEYDLFALTGAAHTLGDDEGYLAADGIVMRIDATEDDTQTLGREKAPWYSVFHRISDRLQGILEKHTDPETADLVGAMLLGNREELGNEISRDFKRVGISHMLALSGLHVSIVIGALDAVMRRLGVKRSGRCVLLIIASMLYLGITGISLSAARAVIMVCSIYVAHLLWTDSDSITALFVSAAVIFGISPSALLDVGYWMSFLATLGIIMAVRVLEPLNYKLKKKPFGVQLAVKLLTAVSVTVAANVAVSAFLWLVYGEISLLSVMSNLIFSIPATAVIMLGLALIALSWLPFVPGIIGALLNAVAELFYSVTAGLSAWRGIVVSLNYDFVKYIIPPMLAVIVVLMIVKLKRKWLIAVPVVAAVVTFSVCLGVYNISNRGISDVAYVKINKSEMITVVNTKQASICDISTGGIANFKAACDEAVDEGATEIENLILTHYHRYHPGAIAGICESYMVRNVYLPEPQSEEDKKWYESAVLALGDGQTNVITYKLGETIDVGDGCTISVSEYYYVERSVHPMYTVRVTNGGESVLYMTSSIYESESFADSYRTADHVIFGIHGPNIHTRPSLDEFGLEGSETVILSDKEKQAGESDVDAVFMGKEGIYRFILGE